MWSGQIVSSVLVIHTISKLNYLCDIVVVRYLSCGFCGNWTSWANPADLDWVLDNLVEECIQCHCPVALQVDFKLQIACQHQRPLGKTKAKLQALQPEFQQWLIADYACIWTCWSSTSGDWLPCSLLLYAYFQATSLELQICTQTHRHWAKSFLHYIYLRHILKPNLIDCEAHCQLNVLNPKVRMKGFTQLM